MGGGTKNDGAGTTRVDLVYRRLRLALLLVLLIEVGVLCAPPLCPQMTPDLRTSRLKQIFDSYLSRSRNIKTTIARCQATSDNSSERS